MDHGSIKYPELEGSCEDPRVLLWQEEPFSDAPANFPWHSSRSSHSRLELPLMRKLEVDVQLGKDLQYLVTFKGSFFIL